MEVRRGTGYEMTVEDYNRKLEALNSKPMRIQMRHRRDVKFRKDCENFETFYVHREVVEKVLARHTPLKA